MRAIFPSCRAEVPASIAVESRRSPRVSFGGGKRLISGDPVRATGRMYRYRQPRRFECNADVCAELAYKRVAGPDDATVRCGRKTTTLGVAARC